MRALETGPGTHGLRANSVGTGPRVEYEEKALLQQNGLPHPCPGPLTQVKLWPGAPSAFLGTNLREASRTTVQTSSGRAREGRGAYIRKQAPLLAQRDGEGPREESRITS